MNCLDRLPVSEILRTGASKLVEYTRGQLQTMFLVTNLR